MKEKKKFSGKKLTKSNQKILNEWYAEEHIIKIWEQYAKKLCFLSDGVFLIRSLFRDSTSMNIGSNQSAILAKSISTLYKNANEESISICRALEYLNESNNHQAERFADFFGKALLQIRKWNENSTSENSIKNHNIIFPYFITMGHWALGTVSIDFTKANIVATVYNPMTISGGDIFSTEILETIKTCFKDVFNIPPNIVICSPPKDYPQQQFDGTSCGVIAAENGKYFIDGSSEELLQKKYRELDMVKKTRLQHIHESECEKQFVYALRENVKLKRIKLPEDAFVIKTIIYEAFNELSINIEQLKKSGFAIAARNIIQDNIKHFDDFQLSSDQSIVDRLFIRKEDTKTDEEEGHPTLEFREETVDLLEYIFDQISKASNNVRNPNSIGLSSEELSMLIKKIHEEKKVAVPSNEQLTSKTKEILNSSKTNQQKVEELRKLESTDYKVLVNYLANKNSQQKLNQLVETLKNIADMLIQVGKLSGDFKDFTDAATFYQYVINISEQRVFNGGNKEIIQYAVSQIEEVKSNILSRMEAKTSRSSEDSVKVSAKEEATANKGTLTKLRRLTEERVKKADLYQKNYYQSQDADVRRKFAKLYQEETEDIFSQISTEMKSFLANLYLQAEREIGIIPPCKYSVVGLGSLALKQITPYSDLEFAIITENDDYKTHPDPRISNYFRNLSHLVNFKMINLTETIIPTSRYDVDMSHLLKPGVNFDLGGKTPLGRIDRDKPYDLIGTIDSLMFYVRNEANKAVHIDKNLPHILSKICYVFGEKNLYELYAEKVNSFLHETDNNGVPHHETKAMQLLKEGCVEYNYLKIAGKSEKTTIEGDLYNLYPDHFEHEGECINVKQEIYRMPDRLLYDLGLFFGIDGESVWQIIDNLHKAGIINSTAVTNLKNAASFATILRLKTYQHNEGQVEIMSIVRKFEGNISHEQDYWENGLQLTSDELEENGPFFQFFFAAMPLHANLKKLSEEYSSNQSLQERVKLKDIFCNCDFDKRDDSTLGKIHIRLADYSKALNYFEKKFEEVLNHGAKLLEQGKEIECMGYILNSVSTSNEFLSYTNLLVQAGKIDKAIELLTLARDNIKYYAIIFDDAYLEHYATISMDLSIAYINTDKIQEGIEIVEEIVAEIKSSNKPEKYQKHLSYAYQYLTFYYKEMGNIMMSMNYAQEGNKLAYKQNDVKMVLTNLVNFAGACISNMQIEEGLKCLDKSVSILESNISCLDVRIYSVLYTHYAQAYCKKGDLVKCREYIDKSLKIYDVLYGQTVCLENIRLQCVVGDIYGESFQWKKSMDYYLPAFEMCKQMCVAPTKIMTQIATNVGIGYRGLKQFDLALQFQETALKLKRILYKTDQHPAIAGSMSNIAAIYHDIKNYSKGLPWCMDALKIIVKFPYNEYFPKIKHGFLLALDGYLIEIFNKIWPTQKDLQIYKESLELLEKNYDEPDFLKRCKEAYPYMEHKVKILSMFHNMGHNDVEEAEEEETLEEQVWHAAANDDSSLFQKVVEENPEINLEHVINGRTPLINAVINGNEVMVTTLLALGANVNKASDDKASPLYYAIGYAGQEINLRIIDLLLSNGADVNQPMNDGDTPMHMAAYRARSDVMKKLLAKGANINSTNLEGKTPLYVVVESGASNISREEKISVIKFLLANGATIDACMFAETPILELVTENLPELLMDMAIQLSTEGQIGNENSASAELQVEPSGVDCYTITET